MSGRARSVTMRRLLVLAVAALVSGAAVGAALAQSSLGIGNSEATLPATGFFSGILATINSYQQQFYRSLTAALKSMRDGDGGTYLLATLSFAYGVFHAAGPGHGKAVISSYMLANETVLRRGILLSFMAAAFQALTAIALMATAFLLLRGTAIPLTAAAQFLETASYFFVMAFGAWLLFRKRHAFLAPTAGPVAIQDGAHDHFHRHETCDHCGHAHMPAPRYLRGQRLDWKSAWAAITAVGLRPCSGAIIVLTFAFLNGLWLAGIASAFAMALGTAITVSVFATLAVGSKRLAMVAASGYRHAGRFYDGIEIAGAVLVFLIGLLLFLAAIVPG